VEKPTTGASSVTFVAIVGEEIAVIGLNIIGNGYWTIKNGIDQRFI